MTKELKALIEDLRLNHEYCPKKVILQAADELERLAQPIIESYLEKDNLQPEQEPCGWQFYHNGKWQNGMETNNHRANTEAAGIPVRDVYPSPQRTWVGLTNEQRSDLVTLHHGWNEYGQAIEAELRSKNT